MVKRISSDDEKRLADQLKREAEASRPAFSEVLHTRICQAVRRCEAPTSRDPSALRWQRGWVYVAIAASGLLCASLVVWHAIHSPVHEPGPTKVATPPDPAPQPPPEPAPQPTPDPLADLDALVDLTRQAPERVGATVESTLLAGQWAYLDHDARLAAEVLIGQLPLDMLASANEP